MSEKQKKQSLKISDSLCRAITLLGGQQSAVNKALRAFKADCLPDNIRESAGPYKQSITFVLTEQQNKQLIDQLEDPSKENAAAVLRNILAWYAIPRAELVKVPPALDIDPDDMKFLTGE